MSKKSHRRALKALKRTGFQLTRPFIQGVDVLPPLTHEEHGVGVPSNRRCHAIGLENGDCRSPRVAPSLERPEGSLYCYYHDKLARGVCEPSVPSPEEADQRDGMALYPTWPLPEDGYVLMTESPRRLELAG